MNNSSGSLTSDLQLLITGCYRSGTEYISLLIGNHPKLEMTMYTTSFMRYSFDNYNPINEKYNYFNLIFEATNRIRKRWNKNLNVHKILDECSKVEEVTYPFLYDQIMNDLFLKGNGKKWGEKIQLVWTKIPDFLDMFPNGKAINIVRDPRSVLASFKKHTYHSPPAYLGAIFNCFDSMKKSLLLKKKYGEKRFKVIKYEDVLLNPENELIDVFKFLNLPYDHNLLKQDKWRDGYNKKWIHNSEFIKEENNQFHFDKQDAINRWKNNLTKSDIVLCEEIIGDLLLEFDYKKSNLKCKWKDLIKPIFADQKLTHFFQNWVLNGEGVEEFPSDPLNPANWEENANTS